MTSFGACTDKGVRKATNQDAYLFRSAETRYGDVYLAIVCDGVGGLASGEIASTSAVAAFSKWFDEKLPRYLAGNVSNGVVSLDALCSEWNTLLMRLNDKIMDYGRDHGVRLGTTFTGMLLCQGRYFMAHVGDSRAYRFSGNTISQLTADQTLVAQELAKGNITAEEAKNHPSSHVILQAVGSQMALQPEYFTGISSNGDVYLFCSDGFCHVLSDEELQSYFGGLAYATSAQMESVCTELVHLDMTRGETDNITALCFRDETRGLCGAAAENSMSDDYEDEEPTVGPFSTES